jgi:predicted phage terminase large subunit-like protein
VYNWVSFYLKDGIFDESKLGIIRHFLIVDDTPVFGDTPEELAEAYPDMCNIYNPLEDEMVYVPPMTFCFIGGTIFDNPALIKANPKYLSALKAQTDINRRRLLEGDWHAVPEGSQNFERGWLEKLDKVPDYILAVRGWDTASEEPSDKNRYPDYTASIKMLKTKEGDIIIVGDYEEGSLDPKTQVYGKYRQRSGKRDKSILRQAQYDGVSDCVMVLAIDPASSGKFQFKEQSKYFAAEGIVVSADPMPNNKSKLLKFTPFSTACQNGNVAIVESTFPNKQTLEAIYRELENFDGERSTGTKKDDWADSAGSAYNYLVSKRVFTTPTLPAINAPTALHNHRKSLR